MYIKYNLDYVDKYVYNIVPMLGYQVREIVKCVLFSPASIRVVIEHLHLKRTSWSVCHSYTTCALRLAITLKINGHTLMAP